jgi:hypothetical protein
MCTLFCLLSGVYIFCKSFIPHPRLILMVSTWRHLHLITHCMFKSYWNYSFLLTFIYPLFNNHIRPVWLGNIFFLFSIIVEFQIYPWILINTVYYNYLIFSSIFDHSHIWLMKLLLSVFWNFLDVSCNFNDSFLPISHISD